MYLMWQLLYLLWNGYWRKVLCTKRTKYCSRKLCRMWNLRRGMSPGRTQVGECFHRWSQQTNWQNIGANQEEESLFGTKAWFCRCELCGQSFWTERSFDLHLLKEHPDFANSKCNDCRLHCKNEAGLKEDLMALHRTTEQRQKISPKNQCSACGKNFLSKIRLNKHKREAHNDFDFEDEPKKSTSKY